MLGAIVGDIVGSVYEFQNAKSMDFDLFTPSSNFTDDSVMTLAVAKWLIEDEAHTIHYLIYCMQELGDRYPYAGYGTMFGGWLEEDNPQPYNSWGNGAGMRVSPVGLYAKTLDEALALAALTASVSHNHPEGVKGAQAIATCVFLCKEGKSKQEIKDYYDAKINFGFILIPMIPLVLFFLKSKSRDNEDKEQPLRTSTIHAGRICLIVILASLAYFIVQILVNRFYLQ